MIQLQQSDFECVGKVAKHCNQEKLCIAIQEAIMFDLKPLVCNLFSDLDANWDNTDEIWYSIINGGTYENCAGFTTKFEGFKTMLAYFAYARYVVINNFDDTPNGGVTKTNQWSVPKPLKELRAYSNKYKTMAMQIWEDLEGYMCVNKEQYIGFNPINCKTCGCNGSCGENVNTKGFGMQGENISKKIC